MRWNIYRVHLLIFILPRILCFMSSNDGKEIILLEKITTGCIAIEIWTSSDRIMREVLRVFLISKIFQWIRPQQITHGTKCWGLLEAIKLKKIYIISSTTINNVLKKIRIEMGLKVMMQKSPFLCLQACVFLAKDLHVRKGTVGSLWQPTANSRRLPCKHRKHAQCT